LVLLFLTVLLVGCAKPPQEDIDAAKASVQGAKDAQADRYAAADLQAAEDLMNQANAEVETQNGKFALFRSYDKAKELTNQAKAAGEKAKTAAIAGKEAAKKDAEEQLAAAQASVAAAKEILPKAPKGKDTRAEIEALTADLASAESSLTDIQSQISREEYLDASAKAKAVKEKADSVTSQVQAAIDKRRGGRR
jgi:hypothetical protein